MIMMKRFESAGFTLNWRSGINWYFASHTDLEYLKTALHSVLGWSDYDCSQFIWRDNGEWVVRFHYEIP